MGKKKVKAQRSRIVDRHPWAVMQLSQKCETCLRMFKWTDAMTKLCLECKK